MSGDFEVGDFLRIYCEKGGHSSDAASWEDWMNIFLKEGNLIWVIEETNQSRTSELGITTQEVLMRLINPENLNRKSKESLKIDLDVPITCRGTLRFVKSTDLIVQFIIYYGGDDKGDFFYKLYSINPDPFLGHRSQGPHFKVEKVRKYRELDAFSLRAATVLSDAQRWAIGTGRRNPSHGETPEQNEVKQIIETLLGLWGEEYMSDFFEGQTGTDLLNYTKGKGGTWGDFLKQAWQEEMIQNNYLANYDPGDYVYDNIEKYVEKYVKENYFKSSNTTPDDLYAMSSNKELYNMFAEGGGRKKRRKRRKTKKRKSKRKSKRSSKKRKSKRNNIYNIIL